jgi:hypothetical protein
MTYTEKLESTKKEFFFKEWIEKPLPDEDGEDGMGAILGRELYEGV